MHIVLKNKDDEAEVRAELNRALPPGMRVQRPAARTELADKTLIQSEQGLHLATGLSLVIALFIIFNTFLMNVSERRRQLAIMRAIGATRRQVRGMMLIEGLILGSVGTVLGIGLGVYGAQYVTDAMGTLMNSQLPRPGFVLWSCLLGAAFGMCVSLAGVYFPARKASKVSPLEGMGGMSTEDREGPHWVMTTVGVLLAIATTVLLTLTILGKMPPVVAPVIAAVFMVSLVMLAPLALPGLSGLMTPLLAPVLQYEGRLARTQLLRRQAAHRFDDWRVVRGDRHGHRHQQRHVRQHPRHSPMVQQGLRGRFLRAGHAARLFQRRHGRHAAGVGG